MLALMQRIWSDVDMARTLPSENDVEEMPSRSLLGATPLDGNAL
jgi:hypothetical protein